MALSFPVYILAADAVNHGGFMMLCGNGLFVLQPLYGRFLFTAYTILL